MISKVVKGNHKKYPSLWIHKNLGFVVLVSYESDKVENMFSGVMVNSGISGMEIGDVDNTSWFMDEFEKFYGEVILKSE